MKLLFDVSTLKAKWNSLLDEVKVVFDKMVDSIKFKMVSIDED